MVGDSVGMSKATRLQKSGLTEGLISEQPSLQVEKPEMKPWKKLTNKKTTGQTILRQLLACSGAFGDKKEEEELAGTVYLCKNVWISSPVHMCPSLGVFVPCVCVRSYTVSTHALWGEAHHFL